MASRYFGIDRGDQGYVTEGSGTGSKDVEFVVDLAIGMSRAEVIYLMKYILGYLQKGFWPIGTSLDGEYRWGMDRGEQEKDITKASSAYATLTNQGLVFTAKQAGVGGNSITLTYTDPPGNNIPLSVAVVGSAITVTLATDGSSTITTTRADLAALLQADAAVVALVGVTGGSVTLVTALSSTPLATGALPAISTNIYLQIDLTAGLTKSDVTTLLTKIENHMIHGNWPPA